MTRTIADISLLSLSIVWTAACGSASTAPTAPTATILSSQAGATVAANGGASTTSATVAITTPSTSTAGGASTASSDADDDRDTREVEGLVTALPPTTAAGQFTVGTTTIVTTPPTTYTLNGHTGRFADLAIGVRVHVKGTAATAAGPVTARVVMIQNTVVPPSAPSGTNSDNDDDHGQGAAEVHGTITAATGSCPALRLTIGGTIVTTSAATRFDIACSTLTTGRAVEVKGTRNADGTITATRIERD